MFESVFCTSSVLENLLIQQVGFVISRHFFQHRSHTKHWFKNLKILGILKFEIIFLFLFFKLWDGFYKTRASCSMCFHFILRGFNTLGNFYWLFLAKIPNKKRGTLYVSRVIKNQIEISQCVILTIMDWYTVW